MSASSRGPRPEHADQRWRHRNSEREVVRIQVPKGEGEGRSPCPYGLPESLPRSAVTWTGCRRAGDGIGRAGVELYGPCRLPLGDIRIPGKEIVECGDGGVRPHPNHRKQSLSEPPAPPWRSPPAVRRGVLLTPPWRHRNPRALHGGGVVRLESNGFQEILAAFEVLLPNQ